jgi:hypothetical protein
MLMDVLTYPVRSGGWLMIAIGAGLSILLFIGQWAPIMGLVAGAFSWGFFSSYYLDIINTTVSGSDELPDWPSITDFMDDIVSPWLKTLGVSLICAVPYLLTMLIDATSPAKEPLEIAARALGTFYFPMATLGLVMHGHLGGTMPHRVLPAISRSLPGYLIVVLMLGALLTLASMSDDLVWRTRFVGFGVHFVLLASATALSLYLLMAQGRLIGLLYRSKREQIGWG